MERFRHTPPFLWHHRNVVFVVRMRNSRILILLALVLVVTFALLALPLNQTAEMRLPATPGGCHGHHAPPPHSPQSQHLCCYAGHQVPLAAHSTPMVALLGVVGAVDAHVARAAREAVVAQSPFNLTLPHSSVLRI